MGVIVKLDYGILESGGWDLTGYPREILLSHWLPDIEVELSQPIKIERTDPQTPFHAIVTDLRMSADYLGDRTLGQNGWSFYGGF